MIPTFSIKYNIHSQFETSVGVIHTESAENKKMIFNGTNGDRIDEGIAYFLRNCSVYDYNPKLIGKNVFKENYQIDWNSMVYRIKETIIKKHTKVITYYGKNNQRYKKECIPSPNHIFISDNKQVYIPEREMSINSLGFPYQAKIIENDDNILCKTDLFTCHICSSDLKDKKSYLCNSCGAIIHAKSLLDSCGFKCTICGKTICRKCAYNGGLLKKYCQSCTLKSNLKLKKIPEKTYQRELVLITVFSFGVISLYFNYIVSIILIILGCIIFYYTKKENPDVYTVL